MRLKILVKNNKKDLQVLDIQSLRSIFHHKNILYIHNLMASFDKVLPIVKETLADQLNSQGNLQFYPNPLKLPDSYIISLALFQEILIIDSEHWFWNKLQADYSQIFPNLPVLSRYNRRRVETVFSQFYDRMMLKCNYVKTLIRLTTRISVKITADTLLQYLNFQNNRPINHVRHALPAQF